MEFTGEVEQVEQEEEEEIVSNPRDWPQRCLKKIILNLTYTFTLFAGSSLFLSGFFTEYLSPDETVSDESQYGSIVALSFGLLVVLYSVFGLCTSCCLKIFCDKYIFICSINAILGLASLTFVAFGKSNHETKTMDVKFEEAR